MKTILLTTILASLTFAVPALAEDLKFTLTNNSEYTVDEFYVSHPDADDWGDDVLGQETLGGSQVATITLTGAGDQCEFDLKAVDEAGEEHVVEGLNVCETPNVTFDK